MTSKIGEDSVAASVIGIDISKNVFHLFGFSADGRLVLRQKIKCLAFEATFRKLPPCIVGMEACLSAHFVSRWVLWWEAGFSRSLATTTASRSRALVWASSPD